MRLSGLVLAGGRSRRMGQDKALVPVGGRRMVDHAVGVLTPLCDEVMLAAGTHRHLHVAGARAVDDAEAGAGPLAGLVGGLEAAANDLVAVLAVDHVEASGEVFRALAEQWAGETAVVPEVDGRPQPLHAIWARSAASDLRRLLTGHDRSIRQVFGLLDVRLVGDEVWGAFDPAGRFARNVNRPEDLPPAARHVPAPEPQQPGRTRNEPRNI